MDIKQQLLLEHSKANTKLIVGYIGNDPLKLQELMDCFFGNTYRVSQRAAMAVSHYFDQHIELMRPYLDRMVEELSKDNLHVAIKRNIVRLLQFVEIPEKQEAILFDHCLKFVADPKETIAVVAFSLGIIANICKKHPELKVEVIPVIEDLLQFTESAGVKNRGKKILNRLNRL